MMHAPPKSEWPNRRYFQLWFDFKNNSGLPLLFLVLVSLPLLDGFFNISKASPLDEKRKLADKPHFSIGDPFGFVKKYDSYFNDNFGFRGQLITCHNFLLVTVFRTSPLDRVVIGRDGWLYLNRKAKFQNEITYYRSLKPFTKAELERWRTVLQQRRQWLARRGIFYIFVVVPNKSTIYPEFLPRAIRKVTGQSRLDQLLAVLRQDPGFPVLDCRESLRRGKSSQLLFYRTDTHWTELGAYFAYREVMDKLAGAFPGLRPSSLDEFKVEKRDHFTGDLALMLSLQNSKFQEKKLKLLAKTPPPFATSSAKKKLGPFTTEIISECPSGSLPTALIVHDSFMHQLKPFFRPHFRRIVYIWDWWLRFFPEEIAREKPKIVIDELVERTLSDLVPENPPELLDPAGD